MKKIWIVYEDNHGDVSYWRTKRRAYKEARDIIMTHPYHYETEEIITRKDISDKDIEEYNYCVGVYSKPIGKSWA
jgi:hypothetical protein